MKVGLVLDSKTPMNYHVREIRSLLKSNHTINLILIDEDNDNDDWWKKNALMKGIKFIKHIFKGNFMVLIFLERMVANIINPDSTAKKEFIQQTRRVRLFEEFPSLQNVESIYFTPKKVSKLKYDFPQEIMHKIDAKCDVITLLGFNRILTGKIINRPKYGVLSFHGADINKYRGRPAQFFEWLNNESEVGMTLQKLSDELDGGGIVSLRHADITDAKSWEEVRVRCLSLRDDMLVEGLDKLEEGKKPVEPKPAKLSYKREAHRLNNVIRCIKKNIEKRYFTN
jgi:methionyl-tRNA formyltransferase